MKLHEVMTEAVADLIQHGFDSQERVEAWMEKIKRAAEESLIPRRKLEQTLRASLSAIYRQMVEQGGAARYHGGVSRFTIQQLRPHLHDELTRRILASADLIRLNREQSIAKTLQRFQGWASSVPAGGVKTEKRREVKYDVTKSLKQLPFEDRRVIIDQGHKLTASINQVIAQDGGAIAMRWHSNWRQINYNYRKDHKERDGEVYLIRDSWAHKKGLVKPGDAGYLDAVTQPAQEPFCRCFGSYIYSLRKLPEDMITAKGTAALAEAQAQARAA